MHRYHHHRSRRRQRMRRHGRRFGPWTWEGRFFEPGEVPLALLSLLEERPRHGYELMKQLEARSHGLYRASAGTVYPTLQQLQDEGLVTSQSAEGGRRDYELTAAGREKLAAEADAVREIWNRAEDDEWGGWGDALEPDAAEVLRPAFRLMRSAIRTVSRSRDPECADQVRAILREAHQRIRDLRGQDGARDGHDRHDGRD
ncbi:MAG: helix-turn-helix transcriptional regulator [Deltaproteobacteria bacterium]|nr:helix-turn-helix transcriptional regulator [Deltaproteobacteria bacterium]MBW2414260.1 helix-turn-helix transcriptional regulator [Deltaproteobacteria bacterium]